jgi:hypothetical protein
LRLHERGLIRLAPFKKRYAFQAAKAVTVLPPIATVACSLAQLGEVQILRVTSREHSALWRGLMDAHHYLKSGPLCGASCAT